MQEFFAPGVKFFPSDVYADLTKRFQRLFLARVASEREKKNGSAMMRRRSFGDKPVTA